MRVRFTIGVPDGDEDRDLLVRYRSDAGPAASGVDVSRRRSGWPALCERSEDEAADGLQPFWAW